MPRITVDEQPLRVMRLASMAEGILAEVRSMPLDAAGAARLRELYLLTVSELKECLPSSLHGELDDLLLPPATSDPDETRVAQAQLAGWLDGVVHCLHASLQAQALETFVRLAIARARGEQRDRADETPPGQYL